MADKKRTIMQRALEAFRLKNYKRAITLWKLVPKTDKDFKLAQQNIENLKRLQRYDQPAPEKKGKQAVLSQLAQAPSKPKPKISAEKATSIGFLDKVLTGLRGLMGGKDESEEKAKER